MQYFIQNSAIFVFIAHEFCWGGGGYNGLSLHPYFNVWQHMCVWTVTVIFIFTFTCKSIKYRLLSLSFSFHLSAFTRRMISWPRWRFIPKPLFFYDYFVLFRFFLFRKANVFIVITGDSTTINFKKFLADLIWCDFIVCAALRARSAHTVVCKIWRN